MKPVLNVRQTLDRGAALKRAMDLLTGTDVLVGIPDDAGQREEDGPVGNAVIGYVHEYGSPDQNIPPRPFLVPGIAAVQDGVAAELRVGAQAALRGNAAGVTAAQTRIGLLAVKAVQTRFLDNDWPALAPATLAARRRALAKKKGQRKPRKGTPHPRPNPLFDTAQLQRAVTYVLRGRNR